MGEQRIRLLLIDDSEVDYQITSRMLLYRATNEYDLYWAPSYNEGVEMIGKKDIDLCLVDYWLDCGKSGIDFLHEIRRQGKKCPVIMLTGRDSEGIDQEAMRAGASDYLVKSRFDKDLLERAIRHALERRRIFTQMEQAKEQAQAASQAKSDFLSNLSHEMRSPLNSIIGLSELLETTELDRQQAEDIRRIKSAGNTLLRLTNDILDMAKIESGTIELDCTRFNVCDEVNEVLALMSVQAFQKGLELSVYVSPDVPRHLTGDPARLRQILTNLLSNAIKFTGSGGEVVVCVEANDPEIAAAQNLGRRAPVDVDMGMTAIILPGTRTTGVRDEEAVPGEARVVSLHFSVTDTGIGVPADQASRIFESFVQAKSTSRKYGGTGLGLTISRKLVELMGGRIWLQSEVGFGSEFHFNANFTSSDRYLSPPQIRARTGAVVKAIVVNRSAKNGMIVNMILAEMGLFPETLPDLQAAYKELRSAPANMRCGILLIDNNAVDVDDPTCLTLLREARALADDCIFLHPPTRDYSTHPGLSSLNIDGFLTKPLRRDHLFELIEACLRR